MRVQYKTDRERMWCLLLELMSVAESGKCGKNQHLDGACAGTVLCLLFTVIVFVFEKFLGLRYYFSSTTVTAPWKKKRKKRKNFR